MGSRCVFAKGLRGETKTVVLCDTDEQMQTMTVLQLKTKIVEFFPEIEGTSEDLRLVFGCTLLHNDEATLVSFGIQHESTIHLIERILGGGKLNSRETTDTSRAPKSPSGFL
ncbi:hypothetical protein NHX12_014252 [Muraenolepis orangiensis]|uniref:Ubiquitin-like domain-containing protein n=1 Tax=Muraenolepis orangiensis TaxID=630683 RepID=A0A9Q0DBL9_9TELE|nr:hypothetical protein NHX12_014252 [Muraenolepis orangiensis]